ncbi:DsbE family thiol:disulfide interchange protein [Geminicoccaceae bacterium 1502E]|nr:DsbE family thiol:disulfide interchange protein [Geminicoccaceae bacterium 1502E]
MSAPAADRAGRRRLLFALPLLAFVGVGAFLALGLGRDPSQLPSALVGREAPAFALPPLEGRDDHGLSRADLGGGRPMLVNFWASWCVPCRVEHPILDRLARDGVTIQGVNHKDMPDKARAFLDELGDPYELVGSDRQGRVSIDWGVYGVPETYLLDGQGRILYRHVGPLQERDLKKLLPMLEEAR